MNKYVIFDLDGTLLDTSKGVLESVKYTIEKMNLPMLSENQLRLFIGPPIYDSLKYTFNLSEKDAIIGTEIFRNIYKDKFLFDAELYPGIMDLLLSLRDNKIKIGVATYKREDYTLKILEKFNIAEHCNSIVGSDFENKLTKKDIINICINKLHVVDKKTVIMVGDTIHDYSGARYNNLRFVGVCYGFGFSKDEKLSDDSSKIFDTVGELKKYLLNT